MGRICAVDCLSQECWPSADTERSSAYCLKQDLLCVVVPFTCMGDRNALPEIDHQQTACRLLAQHLDEHIADQLVTETTVSLGAARVGKWTGWYQKKSPILLLQTKKERVKRQKQ